MDSRLLKALIVAVFYSLVTGCYLEVVVPAGGKVTSGTGVYDCAESTNCAIEISATNFAETFEAIPNEGYEFVRWMAGNDFFCDDPTSPVCALDNTLAAGNAKIEAFVASSVRTWYVMPVFRRSFAVEPPAEFTESIGVEGMPSLPDLPQGRPADLSLLEPEEREVVEAADARAPGLRTKSIELWIDHPEVEVTIRQIRHGFTFGFPIELTRFNEPGDLEWYTARMSEHFSLAVIESDSKWGVVEPSEGVRDFSRVDADVAWAEENGFAVKGHTLLWGLPQPFSRSALPQWAVDKFPSTQLSSEEKAELRALLKSFIQDSISHLRGRISYWDVTNETMQIFAQWFIDRLGPSIVNDAFAWAREADPEVDLIFNEWIVEVFTGFDSPTAAEMRDRVLQLLAEGVPIAAVGQQAHFAPTLAFINPEEDISGRTRIDDYAQALDILAETGLPIHLTETNFIAPDDPELRAAQAEALLRLWWGHPSVEMIVFWGPWNKVAGRDEFDVGFWDDDRNITRHGEAVFALLNDHWRTNVTATPGQDGRFSITAFYGDYIAYWTVDGVTYSAPFSVTAEDDQVGIALKTP